MTAEQLEELLREWEAGSECEGLQNLAPSLARRVLAAEKLVVEVEMAMAMIAQLWQETAGDHCFITLYNAITAYREASK